MNPLFDHRLNLNTTWGISERAFQQIVQILKAISPRQIVEFGSGPSSIRLAIAFRASSILSIESDRLSFEQVESLRKEFSGEAQNLTVWYRPLRPQYYGGGYIFSYEPSDFASRDLIDCVIVDGPPFYALRGREACLYQIYNKVKPGGLVILDDFERLAERRILDNWLCVFPRSFEVTVVNVGHQLAILRKLRDVEPNWQHPRKIDDERQVRNAQIRIRNLLLQLSNEDWLASWPEIAPREPASEERILATVASIRQAYGITSDEATTTSISSESHSLHGRERTRKECLHTLFQILEAAAE